MFEELTLEAMNTINLTAPEIELTEFRTRSVWCQQHVKYDGVLKKRKEHVQTVCA
jgi:hypothetical protein